MLLLAACSPVTSRLAQPGADTGDSAASADSAAPDSAAADTSAADTGKTSDSAPLDTGASCGDGTCADGESCWSCTADCGACDCPTPVEVVFYAPEAWNTLADAMAADPSPCADYGFALPALADDKLTPRGAGEPEAIRARGPRLHAYAEAHWSAWSAEPGDWYDKGVAFRGRMAEQGYDPAAGDTWALNELPSSVRTSAEVREDALAFLRGLYDGPDGDGLPGVVFVVGMGHDTTSLDTYKANVQDWLTDRDFWEQANLDVRHWSQEVYADPHQVCVEGATVAERSTALNHYLQHVAWHAEVGPDDANTAQSYLGRSYTPLMNAVWNSDGNGYGDTVVDLETMQHFVSHQVYAARAWSEEHNHPDGRLGFAWARYDAEADELEALAARLASAIHHAYDEGGGRAAGACSPSGAYTWCQCAVAGAELDTDWETFGRW